MYTDESVNVPACIPMALPMKQTKCLYVYICTCVLPPYITRSAQQCVRVPFFLVWSIRACPHRARPNYSSPVDAPRSLKTHFKKLSRQPVCASRESVRLLLRSRLLPPAIITPSHHRWRHRYLKAWACDMMASPVRYMSLRCDEMPLNAHTGAGPSASTVRDPAAIWV